MRVCRFPQTRFLLCLVLLCLIAAPAGSASSPPAPVCLPLVLSIYPPLPEAPVLAAIDNADADGDYTVAWSASARAESYELQERVGDGEWLGVASEGTERAFDKRPAGQYAYRVRARNAWGDSAWSNVESTVVAGQAPPVIPVPPSRPGGGEGKVLVRVINDCPYALRLEFTGPDPGELVVPKCDTCKVYSLIGPIFCPTEGRPVEELELEPGTYRVYATVDDPSIRPYAGGWELAADKIYTQCFFIVRR